MTAVSVNLDALFGQASGKAAHGLDALFDTMDDALEATLGSYLNVADAYVDFMMSLPFYQAVVDFFDKLCCMICSQFEKAQPHIDAFAYALQNSRMLKAMADFLMTVEIEKQRFVLMALDAFFDASALFLLNIDPFVPEGMTFTPTDQVLIIIIKYRLDRKSLT